MGQASRASWTGARSLLEHGVEGVLGRLAEDPRAAGRAPSRARIVVLGGGTGLSTVLGADVIKAFYTERFDEVVNNCPVPVILAGGPKERDICDVAKAAVADGVSGFAFGRNLFQAENPPELIARLNQILRG